MATGWRAVACGSGWPSGAPSPAAACAKLVGVSRAVLDARPGRGAAAGQAAARTDDLNAFLAWQAHQSVAAA